MYFQLEFCTSIPRKNQNSYINTKTACLAFVTHITAISRVTNKVKLKVQQWYLTFSCVGRPMGGATLRPLRPRPHQFLSHLRKCLNNWPSMKLSFFLLRNYCRLGKQKSQNEYNNCLKSYWDRII